MPYDDELKENILRMIAETLELEDSKNATVSLTIPSVGVDEIQVFSAKVSLPDTEYYCRGSFDYRIKMASMTMYKKVETIVWPIIVSG